MAASSTAEAQSTNCPPPPEWGANKKFGAWNVGRICAGNYDLLRIEAFPEGPLTRGLLLMCDNEGGPGGQLTFQNAGLSGPVTLALKGSAQTMDLEADEQGFAPEKVSQIEFSNVTLARPFLAALVDGQGSAFTLVLTPRGKPALELVFSRTGLAAAVKPLRARCAW